ncbi:MAG: Ig-like domain-containing protein [Chitinophagaceae bacterium]
MNYRSFLSLAAMALVLITGTVTGPGCANIVPPQGGPKDTLPPVLRRVTPADSSFKFNRDRIDFVFDEYIDLDNAQQNLIMSPMPSSPPNITRKLNTMSVRLRDTLEPNTTYSINFGNSIKDVNEGNIMRNYTYVFSTGTYFDSLQLSGKVILAESGAIDTTLTVMLHRSADDSAVYHQKPRYITRVDNTGSFRFRNLPPGVFYLYAIKSEGTYTYTNPETLFAFADSSIIMGRHETPVTLYAYSLPKTQSAAPATGNAKPKPGDKRLKMTNKLQEGKQDLLTDFSLVFETPLRDFDTSKVHFSTDSTFTPLSGFNWSLDSSRKIASLRYPWKENTAYNLVIEKEFATDTLGQQLLKGDTLEFTSRKTADYGKVSLRFRNLDLSKNPVLLFFASSELKGSYPLTSVNFTQNLFMPGEYTLRILEDRNKNGVWDPGAFFGKHVQPELVKPVERKIVVKANWDNEAEIDILAPPAPAAGVPAGRPGVPPRGQR